MIHRYNGFMPDSSHKLYTAQQVRGLDNSVIHEFGIAGYELMQRAGKAVLDEARRLYPAASHWLVLCGSGNNGGDGYVVARLARDAGIKVTLCSLVDSRRLKGDAALASAAWSECGGVVQHWPMATSESCDLVLDALLGTGISRDVDAQYRQAIEFINQMGCAKLAIDIPSGLNADSGCVMGCAVRADCTVSFVGRKRGMYTADGPDYCGKLCFDDLSIPAQATAAITDAGLLLNMDFLARVIKPRQRSSHKGSYGHVLTVGGAAGMSGAARLCAEAALRSGAGRVSVATDPQNASLINLGRPELMSKGIANGAELKTLLDGDYIVAVGPGIGLSSWAQSLFLACMGAGLPLVVDADGLNLLAKCPGHKTVFPDHWILTPHPAEAARLLACQVSQVQGDRVGAAQSIAKKYAAIVVLKGCGTVIAAPSGEYSLCPLGNPGMATAGSGDVLTGVISALLGQGLSCFDAAMAGVVAHAAAGDIAAGLVSEMALRAGDITAALPMIWKAIDAPERFSE